LMSIDQAIKEFNGLGGSIEKYGLTSPFRTIGKRLRKDAVTNVQKRRAPDGTPWEKTTPLPAAKIGGHAKILTSSGAEFWSRIDSRAQKRAARSYRKEYGPPSRRQFAIHRGGKNATKRIIVPFLKSVGRSQRFSKWKFDYGYTPGTTWIEKLQFGGTFVGKRVPKRTILELTPTQRIFIAQTIGNFVDKKLAKLSGR